MSEILELCRALISCPSVTPKDAGCQELIAERLTPLGFTAEPMPSADVKNLWLRHGKEDPLLMFAGHTDVVPPGALEQWSSDPFIPNIRDGVLYGRGAADMKSGVAAMTLAAARYVEQHPEHTGSIGLLLTSDEEGPATDGTVIAVERLQARGETAAWCVVGEPVSRDHFGDVIKNGRRGSLTGHLRIHGVQGHIAYPHLCDNPIHRLAPALLELTQEVWDEGNDDFPPTSFQFSNVNSGTGVDNVVPANLSACFNLRYSTEVTSEQLRERIEKILERAALDYEINWLPANLPYRTPPGNLTRVCQEAVASVVGIDAELSTEGGTSDGRFIRPTGAEVVEVGTVNRSIHKIDEHVLVEDLEAMVDTYHAIIDKLLS